MSTLLPSKPGSANIKVSSKVKEFKPEAVLLDFRSIVNTKSIDEEYFLPYIQQNLDRFVNDHWCDSSVIKAVEALRDQSLDHKFNKNRDDCPLVDDESHGADHAIRTTCQFLRWQMDHRCETAQTFEIHRLLIAEGLDADKIKIPIFQDVVPALKKWKKKHSLPSYIHGDLTKAYLAKIVEHSTVSNLKNNIAGIFDASFGALEKPETYKKIGKSLNQPLRMLLTITEYGKGAKAANKAGMEALLIKRPGVRIREYYETKFPEIESLQEIEFIERSASCEDLRTVQSKEPSKESPDG